MLFSWQESPFCRPVYLFFLPGQTTPRRPPPRQKGPGSLPVEAAIFSVCAPCLSRQAGGEKVADPVVSRYHRDFCCHQCIMKTESGKEKVSSTGRPAGSEGAQHYDAGAPGETGNRAAENGTVRRLHREAFPAGPGMTGFAAGFFCFWETAVYGII